jgi:hypothetical protein
MGAIAMQTERFFADLHAAYARLAGDQTAWQEELDERAELEGTLADGLDEPWTGCGSCWSSDGPATPPG